MKLRMNVIDFSTPHKTAAMTHQPARPTALTPLSCILQLPFYPGIRHPSEITQLLIRPDQLPAAVINDVGTSCVHAVAYRPTSADRAANRAADGAADTTSALLRDK